MLSNLPEMQKSRVVSKKIAMLRCRYINDTECDQEFHRTSNLDLLTLNKDNTFAKVVVSEVPSDILAGVTKRNGMIYPTDEKGWDARLLRNGYKPFLQAWVEYVSNNYDFFNAIISEGEFLVFAYILNYKGWKGVIERGAIYLLGHYKSDGFKYDLERRKKYCERYEFKIAPILSYGPAISCQDILKQYKCSLVKPGAVIDSLLYDYEIDDYVKFNYRYLVHL